MYDWLLFKRQKPLVSRDIHRYLQNLLDSRDKFTFYLVGTIFVEGQVSPIRVGNVATVGPKDE